MSSIYQNNMALCEQKGIRGARLCADLNISKSMLSDLKMGRKKTINALTAQKIADYFQVSVDQILGRAASSSSRYSIETMKDAFLVSIESQCKNLTEQDKNVLIYLAQRLAALNVHDKELIGSSTPSDS